MSFSMQRCLGFIVVCLQVSRGIVENYQNPNFERGWVNLLIENFEIGMIPFGWTVIDGNSDSIMWIVGPPPDTAYAYYQHDGSTTPNEELISPAIAIPNNAESLSIEYNYAFLTYESGPLYRVQMRKYNGNWSDWIDLRVYAVSINGRDNIDLTSYLPMDSIQFNWFYSSGGGLEWGVFCMVDSVVLKYFYSVGIIEEGNKKSPVVFSIVPNPVKSQATISVIISEPTTGYIDLLDVTGRKIATIYKGKFSIGKHSYRSDNDLPAGIYFIIFATDFATIYRTLIHIK